MVCLGNICRSPLAKVILRNKTKHLKIEIDSAGTANFHEYKPADPRRIAVAKKFGINLSSHRARGFCKSDFKEFTYIFVMDKKNYTYLSQLAENSLERSKIHYLRENEEEVPDPYYGDESDFLNVFNILEEACSKQLKKFLQ